MTRRPSACRTNAGQKWPDIGEIVGGSQREERLDVLLANFAHHKLDPEAYGWYADLRKYGSVPHAGFGLGFERMLMFVTGMANIRDVIPFARTPGNSSSSRNSLTTAATLTLSQSVKMNFTRH